MDSNHNIGPGSMMVLSEKIDRSTLRRFEQTKCVMSEEEEEEEEGGQEGRQSEDKAGGKVGFVFLHSISVFVSILLEFDKYRLRFRSQSI